MLNDNEKRALDRYALMPKLSRASIWMIPGVILLVILLEYINDNYMHAGGVYPIGIIVVLASIIFFIVAGIFARSILKKAPYNKSLQAITQRIEAIYINDYADSDKQLSLADISKASRSVYFENLDHYLQEVFHIFDYYPKTLLKTVLYVLIPCLIIVGSYIPAYIYNYSIYEDRCKEVTEVMIALSDAFADSYDIYYDDPYEFYNSYGYYFFAYIDYNMDDYIGVRVQNDGSINYVYYNLIVDISLDKEECLADTQNRLGQLYDLLASADVTINSRYLAELSLYDGFATLFLEVGEYQDLSYNQGNIYINFSIRSINEETARLYIAFS